MQSSSQPEENVLQAVYEYVVGDYRVYLNHYGIPIYVVPCDPVAQGVSSTTPAPLSSPPSAAQFSFGSGDSLLSNNQTPNLYSSAAMNIPADPGLSVNRYSTMTGPGGSTSLGPPSGQSISVPPDNSRGLPSSHPPRRMQESR
jgi:hypothetical protein